MRRGKCVILDLSGITRLPCGTSPCLFLPFFAMEVAIFYNAGWLFLRYTTERGWRAAVAHGKHLGRKSRVAPCTDDFV